MKTTRYFREQVLSKRPYLPIEELPAILTTPIRSFVQSDGRVRYWGWVIDGRDGQRRVLRVVTLGDRETVHNAFYDRSFRETTP